MGDDTLLSREIAELLKADEDFAALFTQTIDDVPVTFIHGHLTGEVTQRPSLTISGDFVPYLSRRKGMVAFEILSRLGDETAEDEHGALVTALMGKLFGVQGATDALTRASQAAAMAAMVADIAERGKVTIATYGPAREGAFEADVADDDLRTVIRLNIAWAFVPPEV